MCCDVLNPAVQDVAERVQGVRIDVRVCTQTGQLPGADVIFIDEFVL